MQHTKNVRKSDAIYAYKNSKQARSPLNRENISVVFQKTNDDVIKKSRSKNIS